MKTTVKHYQGKSYAFKAEPGRGFKVWAIGFSTYWYQTTKSVREAKRRAEQ